VRPTHSCLSWFRTCERASLITLEDNNSDGRIQYTGPAPDVENELTIDRDIMVLANPEIAGLPDWVIGLVAVSFFSAIIMGIFSCRMNKEGAVSGMVVGITFYAACVFYF
jgi:cation/acetate symporter